MSHPPWLRFQAYVVGLPKTGSTSLATVFGGYRTGHEVGIIELSQAGLPWRAGLIDEATFWQRATPRLTRPTLEMDSATCHHLYAELLAQRFPRAVFIHSVRDVGGWISSMLDMMLRYRIADSLVPIHTDILDVEYMEQITGDAGFRHRQPTDPDHPAIPPMMRYWSDHMRRMRTAIPDDRSLVVRTGDIGRRLPEVAALCGVPVDTLRADLAHANRAPHSLNRMDLYGDHPQVRAAYEQYCADIMADMFPQEHARMFAAPDVRPDWHAHCDAMSQWVNQSIQDYTQRSGEAPSRWMRRGP